MASLPDKVLADLMSRSEIMMHRMLQLAHFDMTHRECLQLIAPPEHIDILSSVSDIADVASSQQWMRVEVPYVLDGVPKPSVLLYMRTHEGVEPPLRPRVAKWHGQQPDIERKITAWLEQRYVNGRLCRTVKYVLGELQTLCDTGHQIRYLWPAIMHLTVGTDNDHTRRWVNKYGAYRAVKNAPAIPPELRKAMQDTATWLTQAALLAEVPPAKIGQVQIEGPSTPAGFLLGPHVLYRD
jgi:hypothetical protein